MDQTIIGVLFVSAIAAAIVAILDAVKQRAEKEIVDAQNKILKSENAILMQNNENLKKRIHNYSSNEPDYVEPDATVD